MLATSLTTAGLTACDGNDDDEKWYSMKWETDVMMENGHVISVPVEGGVYKFTCINYMFWFSGFRENDTYRDADAAKHIYGEWVKADIDGYVMTVTISPNDGGQQRSSIVGTTAGNIFDSFSFVQAGQLEQPIAFKKPEI